MNVQSKILLCLVHLYVQLTERSLSAHGQLQIET